MKCRGSLPRKARDLIIRDHASALFGNSPGTASNPSRSWPRRCSSLACSRWHPGAAPGCPMISLSRRIRPALSPGWHRCSCQGRSVLCAGRSRRYNAAAGSWRSANRRGRWRRCLSACRLQPGGRAGHGHYNRSRLWPTGPICRSGRSAWCHRTARRRAGPSLVGATKPRVRRRERVGADRPGTMSGDGAGFDPQAQAVIGCPWRGGASGGCQGVKGRRAHPAGGWWRTGSARHWSGARSCS